MSKTFLSSGDLIADRRAHYAQMLAENGDAAAAADLMAQALELVPGWTAGWDLLGQYREAAGDIAGAIQAWRTLVGLDTAGVFGAPLKLAVHGAGLAPLATDRAYVAALFDDYAEGFEAALLQRLGYAVPELLSKRILDRLAQRGEAGFAHALDLGCGTGLMGERLRRHVSHLEGIDLSPGMVAETARKGIYDRLAEAELLDFLTRCGASVDLVTAADVFVYSGALPPVFVAVAGIVRPGALFAFSIETHEGAEPCVLRPSLRYAHAPEAALGALRDAGFTVVSATRETLRMDRGEPIPGLIVLAEWPVAREAALVGEEAQPVAASLVN